MLDVIVIIKNQVIVVIGFPTLIEVFLLLETSSNGKQIFNNNWESNYGNDSIVAISPSNIFA